MEGIAKAEAIGTKFREEGQPQWPITWHVFGGFLVREGLGIIKSQL